MPSSDPAAEGADDGGSAACAKGAVAPRSNGRTTVTAEEGGALGVFGDDPGCRGHGAGAESATGGAGGKRLQKRHDASGSQIDLLDRPRKFRLASTSSGVVGADRRRRIVGAASSAPHCRRRIIGAASLAPYCWRRIVGADRRRRIVGASSLAPHHRRHIIGASSSVPHHRHCIISAVSSSPHHRRRAIGAAFLAPHRRRRIVGAALSVPHYWRR